MSITPNVRVSDSAGRAVRTTARFAKQQLLRQRFNRLFSKYVNYTMVPKAAFIKNLLIGYELRRTEGCIVECGVWRGGMIGALAEVLGPEREYYLFDSFEGLPPAKPVDGSAAIAWQADVKGPTYYNNCKAALSDAEAAMRLAGVGHYCIKKGWFDETVPAFNPNKPIALLRLDGDWYDSVYVCLVHLSKYLAPDGVIIVDDYYTWDGCAKAVHDYLSQTPAQLRIRDRFEEVCVLAAR